MTAALPVSSPALRWEKQAFETEVVGATVGRLSFAGDGIVGMAPCDVEQLSELHRDWLKTGVWLTLCRIPTGWHEMYNTLKSIGFRDVETLVTFHQATRPAITPDLEIGPARPDEAEACIDLAKDTFTFDRLHRDPEVPNAIADAVRAAWVRNDVLGRAAAPLVARADSRVIGFNLCLKRDRIAVIDLIAVAPDRQRQGIAAQLVEAAFAHFGETIDGIQVGTQADNFASLKLYERTEFIEKKRETTLHWVNPEAAPTIQKLGHAP